MSKPKTPAWPRILAKTEVLPNGCWIYRGQLLQGYGRIWDDGEKGYTHRIAFREAHGWVPEWPETVDHLCHNTDPDCPGGYGCQHRACVNPDHLEAVPLQVNKMRSPFFNPTHCPFGHEYTADNTIWFKNKRKCRTCDVQRKRDAYYRDKERNSAG